MPNGVSGTLGWSLSDAIKIVISVLRPAVRNVVVFSNSKIWSVLIVWLALGGLDLPANHAL